MQNTIILVTEENIFKLEDAFKIFIKETPYVLNPYYEFEGEKEIIINRYICIPFTNEKYYDETVKNMCLKYNVDLSYILMCKSDRLRNDSLWSNLFFSKRVLDFRFPQDFYPILKIIICTDHINRVKELAKTIFEIEYKLNCITFES
jgi:hypothetical protein